MGGEQTASPEVLQEHLPPLLEADMDAPNLSSGHVKVPLKRSGPDSARVTEPSTRSIALITAPQPENIFASGSVLQYNHIFPEPTMQTLLLNIPFQTGNLEKHCVKSDFGRLDLLVFEEI